MILNMFKSILIIIYANTILIQSIQSQLNIDDHFLLMYPNINQLLIKSILLNSILSKLILPVAEPNIYVLNNFG
jgi:hypothetical protein